MIMLLITLMKSLLRFSQFSRLNPLRSITVISTSDSNVYLTHGIKCHDLCSLNGKNIVFQRQSLLYGAPTYKRTKMYNLFPW